MNVHPQVHHKDGPASVLKSLFGCQADALTPTERVLADAQRVMSTLLDDVARSCSDRRDPPSGESGIEVQTSLRWIADMLTQTVRSLPQPMRVVLLGRTQAGKSTLFSYLTGSDVSPEGDGRQRFTRSVIAMPLAGRADVVVVDTPGVGALDGEEDREMALNEARKADLVVWVATSNSQQNETTKALSQLAQWGVPMLLVFNCREHLDGDEAVEQFMAYPDSTFAELDGHRARLMRILDSHCQRPLQVLPIHAAAALLSKQANPSHVELRQVSRIDTLESDIRNEADRRRHHRRAAAIVDTARRALVDAADLLTSESERLARVAGTGRKQRSDFGRRTARMLADVDLQVQGDIGPLFQRFDDWAERHYRRTDSELQEEWEADERRLRDEADELLRSVDARLRRRLTQLDDEVAAAWSKRLEVNLTEGHLISASGLSPRWVEAAGRTAAAAAGTTLGLVIGGTLGNAPGAAIGGTIGGIVGERIGSLLRLRRGQLARRRTQLHESVNDAQAAVKREIGARWTGYRESIQQDLADHIATRNSAIERTEALALHTRQVAGSALTAVTSADTCLLRALLRLEGQERLADHVTTVNRHPGFACVVPFSNRAALREFMLRAPNHLLEQIRPVPNEEVSTVFRRAAYALDAGRRNAVLVPDGDGIRAETPEPLSTEFLAAEAAMVETVINASVHLRSTTTWLTEAIA